MRKNIQLHRLLALGAAVAVALTTALSADAGRSHRTAKPRKQLTIAAQLARVKAANARFASVDAAKAAGYVPASPCVMQPGTGFPAGAMGVHFMNPALAQNKLNAMKPAVLLYAPTHDGGFALVGVEYFKADADQNLATDGDRPTLFGRAFDGPMLGHSPAMPIHYDLHVWLYKRNPSGIFAQFNPDVSCTP